MLERIAVLNAWIDTKAATINELAPATPISKRLQTMPGVGPLAVMAVEVFEFSVKFIPNRTNNRIFRILPVRIYRTAMINYDVLGR